MTKTALVWFKTDLRIEDNETLVRAISQSENIIPVYCLEDSHFKTTTYGFQKTGSFRAQFLFESLRDLDKHLRALGSGLIVVKGNPEEELPKLVKTHKAQKVFAKREVAFEEKQTEQKVQQELFKLRCELETFSTSTLYHAEDLPFSIKDIPDVFTNFRKKTEKDAVIRKPFEAPNKILSPAILPMDYLKSLSIPEQFCPLKEEKKKRSSV
jgi:deoxyribodipyrimidine photo-lyase